MIETPFHIVIYCLKNVLLDPVSRACSPQSKLMHQLADLTFEVSEALTLRIFSQPVLYSTLLFTCTLIPETLRNASGRS